MNWIIVILTVVILLILSFIFYLYFYISKGVKIKIDGDNYTLNGRLYRNNSIEKPCPAILFLSGWNPGKSSFTTSDFYASYLANKHKVTCLTIAFRGMGSDGDINNLNRGDFLNDAIISYDYLVNIPNVDKERIYVFGESFGAYLTCILTNKRNIWKIGLRVPTDFPNDGFNDSPHIEIVGKLSHDWKKTKHNFKESYSLNAIHEYQRDILIVASGRDNLVPKQTIENYKSAITEKVNLKFRYMEKTGHGLFTPKQIICFVKILSEYINASR